MMLLPMHILAGLLGLAAGAVAMSATKGGNLHRKSGLVFVYAMLFMSSSGTVMAAISDKAGTDMSVMAGALTFYLVGTGFLTMRRPVVDARGWFTGFMLLALTVAAFAMGFGLEALSRANGKVDGVPAVGYFVFGVVALLAALLDARLLRVGDIQGAQRLVRHLWRMSLAMWIATASFFLGQAKLFPEPIRKSGLLAIPVVLVLGFLLYWLVRVLWKQRSAAAVESR